VVLALTATGFEKLTCCQPLALSFVKVALESSVPVFVQSRPTWVPVLAPAL